MRPRATWLAAGSIVIVASGAAFAAVPTKVHEWLAFQGDKPAHGIHLFGRSKGVCIRGSVADPRADAWRCIASHPGAVGGRLQDPCFSEGSVALCPVGSPAFHDAVELKLTRPLPHAKANPAGDPKSKPPWAILTSDGIYCYRVGWGGERKGSTKPVVVRGRRATYLCAGAAVIAGFLNRAGSPWTVSYLARPKAPGYVTTAVKAAWW